MDIRRVLLSKLLIRDINAVHLKYDTIFPVLFEKLECPYAYVDGILADGMSDKITTLYQFQLHSQVHDRLISTPVVPAKVYHQTA